MARPVAARRSESDPTEAQPLIQLLRGVLMDLQDHIDLIQPNRDPFNGALQAKADHRRLGAWRIQFCAAAAISVQPTRFRGRVGIWPQLNTVASIQLCPAVPS